MISGAREARPSVLRRLVARAAARELAAFVVPGPDVARAHGIDLDAAGLRVAETPRHADVIVLIGELPIGLKKSAAIAYAQMPRPRAVLAVGAGNVLPLPQPDVSVAARQGELAAGVGELRRRFAGGAFAPEATDFDVDELKTKTEYLCPMHPDVTRDEPGSCPKCGMELVPREAAGGPGHDHSGHESMDHGESDHDAHDSHEEHGSHGGGEHAGHDGVDHGDMGFMSMVAMTQGTPRSSDGLQMEWVNAPFGPLFPGLPGGLSLRFTLDGDTVAEVEATWGVEGWGPGGIDDVAARDFPGWLALLNPLSSVAYRVLALKAVEAATGTEADEGTALGRVGALERERAASHLGWLSGFGHLLGFPWLEERAGSLQLALLWADDSEEVLRLVPGIETFLRRVLRAPLLARRLKGIGVLPGSANASGPVIRARGIREDARGAEEAYRSLEFEPVVREGNDALARLLVRVAEIEQSLGLVRRAGIVSFSDATPVGGAAGVGDATVETPRGAARLRATLEDGAVVGFELSTPSTVHMGLIEAVAKGSEVADALVGVASLDLSPWEVMR